MTDFDTRKYAADRHLSIEMAARELRYGWFEEQRAATGAQAVAVAHHRDDSVETLLMNPVRGTGIRGNERDSSEERFRGAPFACREP